MSFVPSIESRGSSSGSSVPSLPSTYVEWETLIQHPERWNEATLGPGVPKIPYMATKASFLLEKIKNSETINGEQRLSLYRLLFGMHRLSLASLPIHSRGDPLDKTKTRLSFLLELAQNGIGLSESHWDYNLQRYLMDLSDAKESIPEDRDLGRLTFEIMHLLYCSYPEHRCFEPLQFSKILLSLDQEKIEKFCSQLNRSKEELSLSLASLFWQALHIETKGKNFDSGPCNSVYLRNRIYPQLTKHFPDFKPEVSEDRLAYYAVRCLFSPLTNPNPTRSYEEWKEMLGNNLWIDLMGNIEIPDEQLGASLITLILYTGFTSGEKFNLIQILLQSPLLQSVENWTTYGGVHLLHRAIFALSEDIDSLGALSNFTLLMDSYKEKGLHQSQTKASLAAYSESLGIDPELEYTFLDLSFILFLSSECKAQHLRDSIAYIVQFLKGPLSKVSLNLNTLSQDLARYQNSLDDNFFGLVQSYLSSLENDVEFVFT